MRSVLHAFKVYKPEIEGGIPEVIATICASGEQFDHRILVARDRGFGRLDEVSGVGVRRVTSLGTVWSLPVAPGYPLALAREARSADVVALHAPFPLGDLALGLMRRPPPIVVHWHADIVRQKALRPLYGPLLERTLRRAKAIVVAHESVAASSSHLAAFDRKLSVAPYGLDPGPWLRLDAEDEIEIARIRAQSPRLVVCVGRLVGYKGYDVLIRACKNVDVSVVVCGTGADEPRLRALIEAGGVGDRVRLEGRATQSRIKQLLHASSALVMPSITNAEAFGLVQVEAMFCGRAIVNTDLPTAVPWVARHEREALTVPPGNIDALSAAITRLLDEPGVADALGRAGRERALATFTADAFRHRIEAVYAAARSSRQEV